MTTLALIDYGAGNLHSVHNALRKAGARNVTITADADVVAKADRIVLPGVGAFRACRDALVAIPGMVDAMDAAVNGRGVPFLGVCVGMQLLADAGEEFGRHEGLGWIAGTVKRIETADPAIKVPHMGWNDVILRGAPPLLEAGEAYFLHSYHFEANDPAHVAAVTDHGGPLVAAVARDSIVGCQFHPEKSQSYGLSLLSRFLEWRP
ncbi:glutamine amidotransferase [Sphingobium wenxiniae]|uniref:Imidazole glycerol phosphate synthase subunit HisH n=2 Tax=Sphingobium TaxID=165695 RepID=T0HV50_9SPHN|nr:MULTISPECIES: imidazole glycerol phosphate synthase subunit HisH [Sphingobium]EQB01354.1 imidazole glycerol phosphate synthase [Sphingobium baderi LL03]KMS60896.1 imidazole glycerol phosphate synthase [Sphingobium baderi LL03]MBB6191414.1 glutamine amidotransferase [Sphingobium wenxiniae]TWH93293.1 glutamine amidotransferase [Sphingobium wenxiniae]WRD76168.1 imidazole glycerol phosphate synthase subunit HisH [Sphingobium baderi]